ncbi:MAG TPA: phage antirepressor N-terminal domain-containing protein [Ktedonobacterales bacterium]|nr:phage antirepressor N-terminal domain-containing protein [Ktedonobacterales bacterium]
MGAEDIQPVTKVWIPVEQAQIPFYSHELVAVRLEDGRIAAVLRWLCDGLHLDPSGQIERIQRKTALAEGLLPVQVMTDGGPQTMPALTLEVLPGYLFTIDEHRVNKAARADVILFQRQCVKVLAAHFTAKYDAPQQALPAPISVVQSAPVVAEPPTLAPNASQDERRVWRQLMREWLDLLDQVETWRANVAARQDAFDERVDTVELRVDAVEDHIDTVQGQVNEIARLMPEIREKFAAQPLSPAHQAAVQRGVTRLNELTGAPHAAVYNELRQRFKVGKYNQISDARWQEIVA